MKEIEVSENDAGQRLDKFLLKTFPDLSKSMMYKGIRKKKIKVNRKRCTYDQKLQMHDHILLFLPPDVLKEKEREIPTASTQLDIVFEDSNLLIINKPAGLLSQSDQNNKIVWFLGSKPISTKRVNIHWRIIVLPLRFVIVWIEIRLD